MCKGFVTKFSIKKKKTRIWFTIKRLAKRRFGSIRKKLIISFANETQLLNSKKLKIY